MARSSRPVWEGHLRLSLVTCPVALYKATSEGEGVHFHLLHPQSHNRVKQAWKDPTLPEDLDIRRNILRRLQRVLSEKHLKEVRLKFI